MNPILIDYGFDDAIFNFLKDHVKGYDIEKIFITYINRIKEINGSNYPCTEVVYYAASLKNTITIFKEYKPNIGNIIRDMASCTKSVFDDKEVAFTKTGETVYVMTISDGEIHVRSDCSVRSIGENFGGFGMFGSNCTLGVFDQFGQFVTAFNHSDFIFRSKGVLDVVYEFIQAVNESKLEEE